MSSSHAKVTAKPTNINKYLHQKVGVRWLSGRVLDSRPRGREFEPHRRHCVVSLSKNIYPSLELVQPRKTRPFITERLLMGRQESNQSNKHQKVLLTSKWSLEYFEMANAC